MPRGSSLPCRGYGSEKLRTEVETIADGGPLDGVLNINGLLGQQLSWVFAIQALPIVP
jgi:hypothetical protein